MFGTAAAQTGQKVDPNAWRKPWTFTDQSAAVDGCYRAADNTVVCTITVSNNADTEQWFFPAFDRAVAMDKANRSYKPVWIAVGASGKRIKPGDIAEGDRIDASTPAKSTTKVSFAFQIPAQYDTLSALTMSLFSFGEGGAQNIPIAKPNASATKTYPATASIPGYTVTFTNCSVNADSTLNCVANLKKVK